MAKRLNDLLDDEDEDDEHLSRQKTVLVIENDYSYRCELVQMLKERGYWVETADEGFEGIDGPVTDPSDLILDRRFSISASDDVFVYSGAYDDGLCIQYHNIQVYRMMDQPMYLQS